MGLKYIRTVDALDDYYTLAPERWDPRRLVENTGPTLAEFFQAATDRISPTRVRLDALVLDCGHAFEGAILVKGGKPNRNAKSTKTSLRPGDVIVSRLRPYLRQVALIDNALFHSGDRSLSRQVVCSAEFCVIRTIDENGAEPACIIPYLLSEGVQDIFAAAQSGGHHPRITTELILSLPWPFESLTAAASEAELVKRHIDGIRRGFSHLASRQNGH